MRHCVVYIMDEIIVFGELLGSKFSK